MSTALAKKQDSQVTKQAVQTDAMTLVAQAVTNGADVQQIDKLIDLVKFNDEREALRSFNTAFTQAQSEFPAILKSTKAHNSNYAPYSEVVKAIRPVLDSYGLSFRHTIENSDGKVSVTCVLAHKDGHSESTTLIGSADTSGSKNAIQAIGSSVTYLKRYTLEAVTGVVTTDDDDDGRADRQIERINTDQVTVIEDLITEVNADKDMMLRWLKVDSIEQIPAHAYKTVIDRLEAKR